jgi:LysR family nod box-dependent transcriptional activator
MRFRGLDLNLMVALDVLMAERSVSRSAGRLGMSQPAMSAALFRLREYFGDELLVQVGKKMFVTPYAEGLAPHLKAFLGAAEALIGGSVPFDPATSTRTFRIGASDYVVAAVLAPMIREIAVSCPSLGFDLVHPDQSSSVQLQNGALDLLITPPEFVVGEQPAEFLFEERHVVAGCRNHPIFATQMSEEDVLRYGHVAVTIGATRQQSFADRHLDQLGKSRKIEVSTGSFTSVPWLLVDTTRLSLMHERLAREMVSKSPIAYAPLPFPFPVMREMMQHHHARATDEGLLWLRNALRMRVNAQAVSSRE